MYAHFAVNSYDTFRFIQVYMYKYTRRYRSTKSRNGLLIIQVLSVN